MNADANMDTIEAIHTTDEELSRDERVAVDFSLKRRPEDADLAKTRHLCTYPISVSAPICTGMKCDYPDHVERSAMVVQW